MKLYVTIIFVLLTSLLISHTVWEQPLKIRQAGQLEWPQSSVTTEDNEIIHAWSEQQSGQLDLFAMKYDNVGNPVWGDEAILVAESANNQYNSKVITSNDGGIILIWIENISPLQIRGQKLDAEGNRLWSDQGILISDSCNEDFSHLLSLLPNENGGAIVSWIQDTNRQAISLDDNGDNQWTEGGINLGPVYETNLLETDGFGGLVFISILNSKPDSFDSISIKRIGASGDLLWNESVDLPMQEVYSRRLQIIYDNIDSYYLIAGDSEDSLVGFNIKKVSLTGQISPNHIFLPVADSNLGFIPAYYSTNGIGDLFVISYSNFILDGVDDSILAFRINSDLNHVWNESGISINNISTIYFNSMTLHALDSGDLFFVNMASSQDYPDFENDVNLYMITSEGNLVNDGAGLLISQNQSMRFSPFLNFEDDLFIAWGEVTADNYELKQKVLDSNLQSLTSEENECVSQILVGSVYYDNYVSFPLADSDQTLVIWLDSKLVQYNKIKYQIINSDGSVEFANNGIDIADFSLNTFNQNDIDSFKASQNDAGQICIVWESQFLENHIKSRLIDTDGSLLGNDSGQDVLVLNPNEYISNIELSSYNNAFYLTYMIDANPNRSIYSKMSSNGYEWGQANLIDSYTGSPLSIFEINKTINNYCIVKKSNLLYYIYMLGEDGSVSASNHLQTGYDYNFDCDSNNNLFFTWYGVGKVYLQAITESDQQYWNSPVQVSYEGPDDNVQARFPQLLVTDSGINVLWSQPAQGPSIELRAQKIDYSGNKLWPQAGNVISTMDMDFNLTLMEEINGGYFITGWRDYSTISDNYQISIIDSNGQIAYSDNSSAFTGLDNHSNTIKVTNLVNDEIFTTWVYRGGLYGQKVDFTLVDNDDNDVDIITNNLLFNYPNPFNPQTNIAFTLPTSGNVSIDIYNLKGQKVKELVNDNYSSGRYSVLWDGKDDNNKQVASGVYLYKMRSGKYSSTKKMILMK